jgi:hypothetical protein
LGTPPKPFILVVVRRTTLLRVLTAVWGFWFAAAFLELPGAHVCAVHGSSVAAPAGAAAHAPHHHDSAPTTDGQQCTCLSHCSGTSPAAIAAPPVALEAPTSPLATAGRPAPAVVVHAIRPYARPFANGPPVA